jgi:hypothetical protein
MAYAALVVDLTARLANLQAGMDRAVGIATSASNRIESAFAGASRALAAFGGAALFAGAADSIRAVAAQLDAFNDAADRTGASVEELSSLANTLRPYGTTLADIESVAGLLVRSMRGAEEETSRAAGAFKALGVATTDSAGNLRPIEDVLRDVAGAMNAYRDGSGKAALAQDILGRSGTAYLPLLKDLANATRAAATVTSEQAQAAERFSIEFAKLARAVEASKSQTFGPLIAQLAGVAERFNSAGDAAGNFYNRLRLALQPDAEIARLERQVRVLEGELADLGKVRVVPQFAADLDAQIESTKRRLERARRELADAAPVRALQQRDNPALRAEQDRGFAPALPDAPRNATGTAGAARSAREVEDAAARVRALVADAVTGSDIVKAREFALALGELDKLFFDLGLSADVYASALDRLQKMSIATGAEGERKRTEELERQNERLRDAAARWADVADPVRVYARQLEEIRSLVAAGFLPKGLGDLAEFDVQSRLQDYLDGLRGKAAQAADDAFRLGEAFSSAFEKAVVQGGKFSDVLRGLAQDIASLYLRQQITAPMAALINRTAGGAGGGTLFDLIAGAFGGARAEGGPVERGRAYLVGERGPELFVPKIAGAIVPNARQASTVSVVQNIVVGSGVNRSDVAAAMLAAKESAKAEILQSMRRGGAYSVA